MAATQRDVNASASDVEEVARRTDERTHRLEESHRQLWNSLEITKLVVSSLTPLMVLSFGVFATLGAEKRSDARLIAAETRAANRDDELERRAVERENAAKKRDQEFLRQAEDREALRAEKARQASAGLTRQMADLAATRERLLRDQDASRADQIRAQAAEQQRKQRIIEQRLQIWNQLGPKLNDIFAYIQRVGAYKDFTPAQIIQLKRDSDKIFNSYQPFFSEKFIRRYNDYMEASFQTFRSEGLDAAIITSPSGRGNADPAMFAYNPPPPGKRCLGEVMDIDQQAGSYMLLMLAAAEDLGLDRPIYETFAVPGASRRDYVDAVDCSSRYPGGSR